MKERILRVLMVFTFIFMIVIILIAVKNKGVEGFFIGGAMGGAVLVIVSALQYIFIAQWHPLYLFKR